MPGDMAAAASATAADMGSGVAGAKGGGSLLDAALIGRAGAGDEVPMGISTSPAGMAEAVWVAEGADMTPRDAGACTAGVLGGSIDIESDIVLSKKNS